MGKKIYPVSKPSLQGNELKYVTDAVKTSWVSSRGDYVDKFEKKFADYHKAKYGVACSSGTTALMLALKALRIGEGDEVIVPEFTMIATAWAVSHVGATPVFVDGNGNINVDKIEEKITPRTKAIIPVHIYGRRCDIERVNEIARWYNLKVIEDSAEAHSTPLNSDIACFSLYGNKIITSGEGGICITNDSNLAFQMEHLRGMAFDEEHTFYHPKIAYNFRMTNMQGAIALAQLEKIDTFLKKRKQIEKWYDKYLEGIDGVLLMPKRDCVWFYDIWASKREKLIEYLKDNGIETRRVFKPMSQQPMYRGEYKKLECYPFSICGMYLPTYVDLEEKDIKYITNKIKEFYEEENFHCRP
jgi:perosamine synthetase